MSNEDPDWMQKENPRHVSMPMFDNFIAIGNVQIWQDSQFAAFIPGIGQVNTLMSEYEYYLINTVLQRAIRQTLENKTNHGIRKNKENRMDKTP